MGSNARNCLSVAEELRLHELEQREHQRIHTPTEPIFPTQQALNEIRSIVDGMEEALKREIGRILNEGAEKVAREELDKIRDFLRTRYGLSGASNISPPALAGHYMTSILVIAEDRATAKAQIGKQHFTFGATTRAFYLAAVDNLFDELKTELSDAFSRAMFPDMPKTTQEGLKSLLTQRLEELKHRESAPQ